VKRFDAIQNLGAVKVLCSDKTGTLTIDLVRISSSVTPAGEDSDLPIKLAFINSSLQTGTRSPIDRAIVDYVCNHEGSLEGDWQDDWLKHGEVPFDSTRRLLSVLVAKASMDGDGLLVTKGAVEEILERCVSMYRYQEDSVSPSMSNFKLDSSCSTSLSDDDRRGVLETAKRLNEEGLRLIAVACKTVAVKAFMTLTTADEDDLVFIGFVSFLDPLKPDAAGAIKELSKLNVQVRILTGDAPAVAAKVARDLGLLDAPNVTLISEKSDEEASNSVGSGELVITGPRLAELSKDKDAFAEAVERAVIFAKLSPYQKLEVVKALRAGGGRRAVAFLGDGVNDALAIRGADVGISVDSGTEIAKEAADVILLEKSLHVVAVGVVQGRIT